MALARQTIRMVQFTFQLAAFLPTPGARIHSYNTFMLSPQRTIWLRIQQQEYVINELLIYSETEIKSGKET
jgi:hypothetical protein